MDGAGNSIGKFDCFSEPATLGPRWKRWLNSFELYADGKGLIVGPTTSDADKQRRRALLLHLAGPDVQDIFETLGDIGVPSDYAACVEALNAYFVPKTNIPYARHVFRQIVQKPGETVLQFVTRLRLAAKDCEYGADKDNIIRDEVLYKCTNENIRRKLLEAGAELTLTKLLEIARQEEKIVSQMAHMGEQQDSVNRVQSSGKGGGDKSDKSGGNRNRSKQKGKCYRCGKAGHYGRDENCPAKGKTCHKCGGADHFSNCCKSSKKKKKSVNNVESEDTASDTATKEYAFRVSSERDSSGMLDFTIGGVPLKMLVDSGATTNVIDEGTWEDLKSRSVNCVSRKANISLRAYASDKPLDVIGTFECDVVAGPGNKLVKANFTVIKGRGVPLLGRRTATELNVLRVGYDIAAITDEQRAIKEKYPECCSGIGKMKNVQVVIHEKPGVTPVACPRSPTPYHLRPKVDKKVEELLDQDIIEKVDGPTPWLNRTVVVPKPSGDIRLCLDMREANKAIERARHPIPTVDEVLQDLNGSTVFSKIDLKWGYHQLELAPESRNITAFATHSGLYRYKRLVFGVTSASEQYQHEMAKALAGIEGVENISDDLIVHGKDQAAHDVALHAVMQRLKECELTINLEKSIFNMSRLVFMGMLLSEKGIGPTEARVQAILDAREPANQSEMRSFLGLANYSSRFIPRFATITDPLRRLLHKDAEFDFGVEQKAAFSELKRRMADATTLAYFDKDAPTKVIADASPVGLGAVLVQVQKGSPVAVCYASRALTDVEKRYSQTEKEALGLVWACERFHQYIYGKRFDLVTDHKPLEVIYSTKSKPCARIQRWVLRMQPYEYRVVHIPGPQNVADPLSRLLNLETHTDQAVHEHGAEDYVRFVAVNATPAALTTRDIEQVSAEDDELEVVRGAIETGRYEKCKQFAPVAGELCKIGQLVLRGTRIVIPCRLRPRVLALAHEGHLGVVGTKQNLRTKVWWPGIDRAAERHCKSCHGCQLMARPDSPEPITVTPLPDGPWQDLAADLMGPLPSGENLLVVVDYFSRFYEVRVMRSTVSERIIDQMDDIFSVHGFPVTLKTDNGPQFISREFSEYCDINGIKLTHTTARWAQANGEVERQNQSLGKRMKIAQEEGRNWRIELRKYLRQYRSLPHPATGRSPAELLFGRTLRGKIPVPSQRSPLDQEVRDRDNASKAVGKMYADARRHAQPSDICVGDQVLMQREQPGKLQTRFSPEPLTVVSRAGNSVVLVTADGTQYSRNTSHLHRYTPPGVDAGDYQLNDDRVLNEAPYKDDYVQRAPIAPEKSVISREIPERQASNAQRESRVSPAIHEYEPMRSPAVDSPRPQRIRKTPKKYEDYDCG